MKKKIILLLLCVFSLATIVYAHPGMTDDDGGHTDGSTGEYHYHHGYPAHEHYDMDGDGDIDCPYDFDDQTGMNSSGDSDGGSTAVTRYVYRPSGTSSSTKSSSNNSSASNNSNTKSSNTTESTQDEEESNVPSWIYWIMGSLVALSLYLYTRLKRKNERIEQLKEQHNNAIEKLNNQHNHELSNQKEIYEKKIDDLCIADKDLSILHAQITSEKLEYYELRTLLSKEYAELAKMRQERSRLKNAPPDVTFAPNGLPVYWKPRPDKPYGDYTVYWNQKSGVYHTDRHCSAASVIESHLFIVYKHARPCRKCALECIYFKSLPDWYTQMDKSDKVVSMPLLVPTTKPICDYHTELMSSRSGVPIEKAQHQLDRDRINDGLPPIYSK